MTLARHVCFVGTALVSAAGALSLFGVTGLFAVGAALMADAAAGSVAPTSGSPTDFG